MVYFLGFGLFFAGMPKYIDDYWHIQELRPWFESQGLGSPEGGNILTAGVPWKEILSTWEWRYQYDNLRLTTMLVVFFLILPKWVGSLLSLGFWVYAVIRGLRLAGVEVLRSPLVPWALVAYYVLMPWSVCMGSVTYQFSYLVASGLSVWLLSRILRSGKGNWWTAGTVLLGFVTGWWHEGFGLPLCCGVIVIVMLRKENREAAIFALAGLVAGTLLNVLSPGLLGRGEAQLPRMLLNWGTMQGLMWQEWMFWVGLVLLVVGLTSRKWRVRNKGKLWIWYMPMICLSSMALLVLIPQGARVGWACALFSVPWSLGLLGTLIRRATARYNPVRAIAGVAVCLPVYAGLALTGAESLRLRGVHAQLVKDAQEHPDESGFFGDYKYIRDLSPLMLKMPQESFYTSGTRFLSHYIRDFRTADMTMRIYCIPRELEYVTAESGEPVPGEGGFRRIGNKYFAPCPDDMEGLVPGKIYLDFGKGYTSCYCFVGEFKSKGDGKTYIFMEPTLGWYVTYFKNIKRLGRIYLPED